MALAFENKVPLLYRVPFVAKVKDIASKLGIDPNWLMGIMDLETSGTFSPSITNKYGYVGLIQFGKSARAQLGVTLEQMQKMSAVEQLDYVYKYFLPHKNKLTSYVDSYLVVFFPIAVGKGDNFLIEAPGISASSVANANPSFKKDGDNKIYVWEVKKALLSRLPSEWLKSGSFSLFVKSYSSQLTIGVALIITAAITFFYYKKEK